jgi:hypothetical protein
MKSICQNEISQFTKLLYDKGLCSGIPLTRDVRKSKLRTHAENRKEHKV